MGPQTQISNLMYTRGRTIFGGRAKIYFFYFGPRAWDPKKNYIFGIRGFTLGGVEPIFRSKFSKIKIFLSQKFYIENQFQAILGAFYIVALATMHSNEKWNIDLDASTPTLGG